jgi:hypothetical protein
MWWARRTCPEAVHVDLLEPEVVRRLAARPERLREIVAAVPRAGTVVIDEVQKLPAVRLDEHLGLEKRVERFPFQQLVPELPVEALHIAVLPR